MRRRIRAVVDAVRVLAASVLYARAERRELLDAHIAAWRAGIESVPLPTFSAVTDDSPDSHQGRKTSDRQAR